MTLYHPEQQSGDPNQDQLFDIELTTNTASKPTLRTEAANDVLPGAPDSPAAIAPYTPVTKTREQSRVFSSTHVRWAAAGGAVAIAAGATIFAVTRGEEAPPKDKVVATIPTATTPANTPTTSTKTETATPRPTDIPTTPAVPEVVSPTPLAEGELYGTVVSMPLSYFEGLINQDKVDEITIDRPEIAKKIRPSDMSIEAAHQDITGKKIAAYQKYLDSQYANPDVKAILATPGGLFDPQSLPYFERNGLTRLISATSDTWLVNIANQVHANLPGASSDLLKTAFLSNELIKINKAKVDGGVGSVETGTFYTATSTEPLAAYNYQTMDGANVTLIAAYSTYQGGEQALSYYVLVPFESANADLDPGSFVAIPFYRGQ